jgi:Pretoxin HINT domain
MSSTDINRPLSDGERALARWMLENGAPDAESLPSTTGEKHFPFDTCFPRGTIVHTDRGSVPIEQIKVGDLVLSQPEMTGAIGYKPVLRTFCHQDETIVAVSYVVDGEGGNSYMLYPTRSHPFWVLNEGWRRADVLGSGVHLLLADGRAAVVLSCVPVYRTSEQSVGWYQKSEYNDHVGFQRNFGDGPAVVRAAVPRDDDIHFSDDPQLRLTVYNFEVGDNHTYYVGSAGVWVHNDDCSGNSMRNGARAARFRRECQSLPMRPNRARHASAIGSRDSSRP